MISKMLNLIKKNMNEINLETSVKITNCIKDINNLNDLEKETLIYISETYYCSFEAILNFRKFIKNYIFSNINGEKYDICLILLAENLKNNNVDDFDYLKKNLSDIELKLIKNLLTMNSYDIKRIINNRACKF